MSNCRFLLEKIKNVPKEFEGESPTSIKQRGHMQWKMIAKVSEPVDIDVGRDDISESIYFEVFIRQSENDPESFSCGIMLVADGDKTMLARYNGSNHKSKTADKAIVYECHIHRATAERINSGCKVPEHADTLPTDEYHDLDGAIKCLCSDYNITIEPKGLFGSVLT